MRFVRLDRSGRSKPSAVVDRLGCVVNKKLEVEDRNGPDLVRMPADLYTDMDWLLPVQDSLVDQDRLEVVLLGSHYGMATKKNLVEVEHWAKGHCYCGGQGRADDCHRLIGGYTGAECC